MRASRRQIAFVLLAILIAAMLALAIAQSAHLHAAPAMPTLLIVVCVLLFATHIRAFLLHDVPLRRCSNLPRPARFQLPPPASLR